MIKPFDLLRKYASRQKRKLAILTLLFVISSALLIIAPRALSGFIDSVYDNKPFSAIFLAILLYMGVTLIQLGITAVLNIQITSIGQRITNDLRRDVLKHYLSLDSETLFSISSGDAMTRIDEDSEGLFQYYYILLYRLTGSALLLLAILITLATKNILLCGAMLIISVAFILIFKIIQDKGIAKYVRSAKAAAVFNGKLKEIIQNAAALRAVGAEKFGESTLKSSMRVRYRESFPASLMYGNLWSAATMMDAAVMTTGLVFAVSMWDKGLMSFGMAYMIYSYADLVCAPLQDFRNHMGNMQSAKAGILRTKTLLEMPVMESDDGRELDDKPLDIAIKDLSFTYQDGVSVIKDMNLNVAAGQAIGLVGETGCGKSTLIGCIAGMNGFESGEILIGGTPLCDISRTDLRKKVAYVSQKSRLIHATLRENITYFDSDITDSEIMIAIKSLNLEAWFSGFAAGLDTNLALGEDNLSSGEARLISLIRLALRKPRIVLLDEITAGLDAVTERNVISAVKALCSGRTVIFVAHNTLSLDWMDEVYRMDSGRLEKTEVRNEN